MDLKPTAVKELPRSDANGEQPSTEHGAALDMVENGIDLVPIICAGGWKAPGMVRRYTQQIDLAKSGMAKLHAMRLRGSAA